MNAVEADFSRLAARSIDDFKDHIATATTVGNLTIVTWKRPNEWAYAMRIVFDPDGNAVYITGDLGEAVIHPTCPCTPEGMATCFTTRKPDGGLEANPRYFVEKIAASSDRYTYDLDKVLEELAPDLEEYRNAHAEEVEEAREAWEAENPGEEFDEDDYNWDNDWLDISEDDLADRLGACFFDEYGIVPSGETYEFLQKLGVEGEDIQGLGQRYHVRIALWLVAFRLIYEQLKEQEVPNGTTDRH